MVNQKTICILWSQLAINTAGPKIFSIHEKFLTDISNFLSDARITFTHVIHSDEDGICYLFSGEERTDHWQVFCQIAMYRGTFQLPNDFPTERLRGKVMKFPEAIESPENERFVPFERI